jgi:lipopolysaccharide/colanic/teichoic acid biosynthesis glycosyltransferase
MLARCYVLAGAATADQAVRQQTGERLRMPLLGSTLADIGGALTARQLGCPVKVVAPTGAKALSEPVANLGDDWALGIEDGASPQDKWWLLITDGCAIAGARAETLSRLLQEHGDCDAAFIRMGRNGYREEASLDHRGQLQAIARRYPTDLALEAEAAPPDMLIVRCRVSQSIFDGRIPLDFAELCRALDRARVKLAHRAVPGRAYRLMADDDVLQLQADILSCYCSLLPRRLRRAASEPVAIDRTVSIADSAVVRGPIVLGRNVRIEAAATVLGPCTIGDDAILQRGCLVRNAVIMPATCVPQFSHIGSCIVGLSSPGAQSAKRRPGQVPPSPPVPTERSIAGLTEDAAAAPASRCYRFLKRAVDVTIAVGVLLLFLPFFPIVALAIKVDSRGPVFFIGRRQTRGGRSFGCIKFRTMVPGAKKLEQQLRAQNKVDGLHIDIASDPRVTRLGSFLRRTNLDELPQLLNVLLGDMSLVGPRPSPDNENRLCPAWREARLSARAGITGLWQVCRSADRGENDFQEWIYYDIEYVRHQSLWLDIRILLRTLGTVICGFFPILWRLRRRRRSAPSQWWRPAADRT